jgi:hypothetical protein
VSYTLFSHHVTETTEAPTSTTHSSPLPRFSVSTEDL